MKKKILIINLILSCFLLSGCFDYEDISQIVFIDSIGIDFQDGKYHVYLHSTNPNTLTTTEQGSATIEDKYSIAKGEGNSIFEALHKIIQSSNYELQLTHIKSFVVTKSFYTLDKMYELYHLIKTYPSIYLTANMFVTDSKIEDLYSVVNPESISPYFSIIGRKIYNENYRYSNYVDFSSSLLEKNLQPYLTYISSSKDVWKIGDKEITSISITGKAYLLENEAIFVKTEENPGIQWQDNIKGHKLEIDKEHLFEIVSYSYSTSCNNNNFIIKIKMDAKRSILMEETNEELEDLIKNKIKGDIIDAYSYLKSKNVDYLNINDTLYRYNILSINNNYLNIKIAFKLDIEVLL